MNELSKWNILENGSVGCCTIGSGEAEVPFSAGVNRSKNLKRVHAARVCRGIFFKLFCNKTDQIFRK